jgi:ribosomal protein L9
VIKSSKTYKEQEDRKSLSKNNGKAIRYLRRKQEEEEAQKRCAEELKEYIDEKVYQLAKETDEDRKTIG